MIFLSGKSSKMGILFYNSFFSALMMISYLFVEYQYYEVKNYHSLSSLNVILNSNHDFKINENQNIVIPTTTTNNNRRVLLSNQLSQYRHNNHHYDDDVYNNTSSSSSSSSSSVFIGIYHDTNDYFHIYNSKEHKLPFITRISNHSDNDLDYHDDKRQDSSIHDLHHVESIDIDHNQHQNNYQNVKYVIPIRNLRQLVNVDVSNNNNNDNNTNDNKRVTTAISSTTTTTATSMKHDEINNSIKKNKNNNIVSIDEIKKANELLLEKHNHLNQLMKDTYHQQKIYKNYSTISELYLFDGWYDLNFLFMLIFTCFMGSILNYAIFICTAMNSALTTAVIGALKNIATTYFAMIIFSDYEFTWLNFMGINISTIGSFYYTYITLFKKSSSSSNSSGIGNSGSNISCDSSSNDISDGGNSSMETLKERAL